MRRVQHRDIRDGSRRVKRIRKQIIVKDILIAPEAGGERVCSAFREPQAAHIQWVAAVSEVAEAEIIKQFSGMRRRAHVERVLQQPGTAAKVYKRVPHCLATGEIGEASAKFGGLLDFKATKRLSLIALRIHG